jgi:hypothetical protein
VYPIELPAGTKTMKLPDNDKVRILAISMAKENPEITPVQPLYDVLPSRPAGPSDFSLSTSVAALSVPQGMSATMRVRVSPRRGFKDSVLLTASGLPQGVTAEFSPAITAGTSTMTLKAAESSEPTTAVVTIAGAGGGTSHTSKTSVTVSPVVSATTPVDLSSAYNVTGIYDDGVTFTPANSLDGDGYAFSKQLLGATQVGNGVIFKLGPANAPDVVTGKTVALPSGKFSSLSMLAVGVNGSQDMQTFLLTYTEGTSSSFTQSLSDWNAPRSFDGESVAVSVPYRLEGDAGTEDGTFHLFAYSFALEKSRVVSSMSLPNNRDVLVFAMTLVP